MILSAAGIISKILSVAFVPFLTLILSNEGNGIYNAGYQIYAFIYVIANQGAPVAISKLVSQSLAQGRAAQSKRLFEVALRFMLILGAVLTLATVLLAAPAAKLIEYRSAELTIIALAPTMLFTALSSVYRGYFQGRKNMTPTAVSQILEQVAHCVFAIVGALIMRAYGSSVAADMGLTGQSATSITLMYASMGATFGTSIGALISWCYLGAVFDRNREAINAEASSGDLTVVSNRELLGSLLRYIVPISIGAALVNTANLVDLINVKSRLLFAGFGEAEATSLYGILSTHWQKIINIPLALVTAMTVALIPQISSAFALKNKNLVGRKIRYAYRIVWMLTVPATVGMAVLARPLLYALFPSTIRDISVIMMQLGSASVLLIALVNMQTAILQGVGKVYIPPIIMTLSLGLKIVLNYFLVANKDINVLGAVISTMICYLIAAAVNQLFIRKYVGKCGRGMIRSFLQYLFAALVMGCGAYLVNGLMGLALGTGYIASIVSLAVSAISGAALYFFILSAINGKLPDVFKMLSRKKEEETQTEETPQEEEKSEEEEPQCP